jgi:D-alanine-D-alanine ligase
VIITKRRLPHNKDFLSVLKPYGIKKRSFLLLEQRRQNLHRRNSEVGLPCFVKPIKQVPVLDFKSKTEAELPLAIALYGRQRNHHSFLTALRGFSRRYQLQGMTTVLPITEIVSENEFFDYEAKYLGKSQEITPHEFEEMTEIAKRL